MSSTEPRAARGHTRRSAAGAKGGKLAWNKARTRELFRRYKLEGDREARDELIENHMNLVRFLASNYKNRGESIEDLVQVGSIGLIKAIDRFDIERGLEFTTFATPTITGEIKRHFRDKGWAVHMPRRLQEMSEKVNRATDTLTVQLQRTPKPSQVAEYLGVTIDEVLEAMESSGAYSAIPLEAGGGTEEESQSVMDTFVVEDEELNFTDDRMIIQETIKSFSPREQEVIRMRFVDNLTQVEIARRLGVSQVQVSRFLRRTLAKVRHRIDPNMTDSPKE